jgi:hypothetical protein
MRCLLLDRCECLGKPASNRCDSSSISWHPFAVEAGIAPPCLLFTKCAFGTGGQRRCTSQRPTIHSLVFGCTRANISDEVGPIRALFTVIPGECIKSETVWRREVYSNCRYRFVNSQTTASG